MLNKKNTKEYWLYGKHPVFSAMENIARRFDRLLANKKIAKHIDIKYKKVLEKFNITLEILPNKDISKEIGVLESTHQGLAISTEKLKSVSINDLIKKDNIKSKVLILDQVTDPMNIGAIIRSSLAFGIDAVITTTRCAPPENSTIVKSSAGAFEHIPYIQVTNIRRLIDFLKKNSYWVASIVQHGSFPIKKLQDFHKLALIIGSEGQGVRRINLDASDVRVQIKMSAKLDSLNVSNATAIILHSLYKVTI